MKKWKIKLTNAIDAATTTNFEIPDYMFDRELEEYKNGGVSNA